ncbi:MAG: efflux RND transporter periplasmic adaptor subunit [Proteobacteria bacterium]|nr:efflux RND transporter periplasmic adaptor subunit [Pseudomonadota bacterium]
MIYLFKNELCIIAVSVAALVSCSKMSAEHAEKHEHEGATGHEGHADHEGHGHGENEASDLDRPVVELFKETCEHNIETHKCDECRYEVGVVKAPSRLFEGKLLKTTKTEKRSVVVPLRLTGEVQFDERRIAHVSAQVGGIIRKVHVTLGDKVTKGQALLQIESVEVGNAKAVYQEALAKEKLAQKNNDRIQALHKEGISSEKEVLRIKQELDAAQIHVNAARGTLRRLGMGGSKARGISLGGSSGKLILRAPSDGTVLEMHAVSGEVARSDESLVTIGDNSFLWVWADLYEKNYALVSGEQAAGFLPAEVSVKAFPDQTFAGKLDFVSPSMSESSRTVKVRIAVPNPDGKLLAGMFADVDIFLSGNQQALSLPKSAILEDEGRAFVFVHHQGDYYVRRPVDSGRKFAGWVEITGGLQGNEVVVSDGAFLLKSDVLRSKMGAGCAD